MFIGNKCTVHLSLSTTPHIQFCKDTKKGLVVQYQYWVAMLQTAISVFILQKTCSNG